MSKDMWAEHDRRAYRRKARVERAQNAAGWIVGLGVGLGIPFLIVLEAVLR